MLRMARSPSPSLALPRTSSRILALRAHSSHSSSSPSPDAAGDSADPLLRKLEDVIHHLIVRRSEPDWLPFRPGSSYWVPPRSKSRGIAQLIGKLASSSSSSSSSSSPYGDPFLSSSSAAAAAAAPHGWPSSSFFIHGDSLPPLLGFGFDYLLAFFDFVAQGSATRDCTLPSAYPEEALQTPDGESQSEDEEG